MTEPDTCDALYIRELAHRTANVLQMAIAAVHLSRRGKAHDLNSAMVRLNGAAELNELLIKRDGGIAELGEQVARTCDAAGRAAGASDQVELLLDVDKLACGVEDARRISMIVAELVTNCIRHAFPEGRGSILIELRDDGRHTGIMVEDDGDCTGWSRPGGQGGGIIEGLAALMDGQVRRQRTAGGSSRIEIVMPSLAIGTKSPGAVEHAR